METQAQVRGMREYAELVNVNPRPGKCNGCGFARACRRFQKTHADAFGMVGAGCLCYYPATKGG